MRYNIVEMFVCYMVFRMKYNGCYNAKLQTFILRNLSKTI